MKRIIIALVAGAAVFGSVFGLAAALNVGTTTLGAGNTTVAACQSATLTAAYTTGYDAAVPGYKVTCVSVSGLQSTCYAKAFKVTITGAANAVLAEITGTTPSTGSSFTADFSAANPAVQAASASGLHVLITG